MQSELSLQMKSLMGEMEVTGERASTLSAERPLKASLLSACDEGNNNSPDFLS